MALMTRMGATLQCTFGAAPSALIVVDPQVILEDGTPAANIMDHVPIVNIPPFGMCTSLANPTVASATAAALGVLTPMPCVPVTPGPWAPGAPTATVRNMPALTQTDKCMCTWAGVISVVMPGAVKTVVQ